MWYDSEGNEIDSSGSSYYDEDGTYYNYSTYEDEDGDYSSYYSYSDDGDTTSYATTTYTTADSGEVGEAVQGVVNLVQGVLVFGLVTWLIVIAVCVLMIVSKWKIFAKAKKHGYAALIPIHEMMVTYEVARVPGWYFFLSLIPFVNIYIAFKTYIYLARQFGKSTGFGVLMTFFPFVCLPILAFSKAKYLEDKPTPVPGTVTGTGQIDPID